MSLKRPSPGARSPCSFRREWFSLKSSSRRSPQGHGGQGPWVGGTGLRVNTLTQGAGPPPPGSGSLHAAQPAPCPGWGPTLRPPGRASGVPGPLAASGRRPVSSVLTASEPQGGGCGREDCTDLCGHPRPGSAPRGVGRTCPGWGRGSPPGGRRLQERVPGGRSIISFRGLAIISPSYKGGNRPREGQLFTQDLPPAPGFQWEVCDSDPSLQPQAEGRLN